MSNTKEEERVLLKERHVHVEGGSKEDDSFYGTGGKAVGQGGSTRSVNHATVDFDEVNCPHCGKGHSRALLLGSQVDMVSIHEEMNEGGEEVPFLKPGSAAASTFSLACMSLGVGVFVLPNVFTSLGLVLGTIMVFLFGILSDIAILLLLDLAEKHCLGSFEEIMELAFGPIGRSLVSTFVAVTCCIGNAGHLQFTAQVVKDLFQWFCSGSYGRPISTEARALLIFAFGLMVMPFCFAKTLNTLRYMSTATVFYVIFMCTLCTCYAFRQMHNTGFQNTDKIADFTPTVLLDSAPVIAFAYSGVLSFFHVYREIKDKKQIRKCLHISTTLCSVFYTVVALAGSLAFQTPSDDYLYSFPAGNKVVTVACVGLVIVIVLLYPVINFPLVAAIDAVLFPNRATSFKRRRLYSIVVLFVIVSLDVGVPKIQLVFGLAGALGLGMVAYSLPCAAYLRLHQRPYMLDGESHTRERNWKYYLFAIMAVVIFLVGATMAVGSTARIIYKASHE